jgi:hypothetical protein
MSRDDGSLLENNKKNFIRVTGIIYRRWGGIDPRSPYFKL